MIAFANIYWLQPLLPTLQNVFVVSSMEANLAMSVPLLGLGVGLILFASLSDTFGRCTVLLSGMACGLCFSILLPVIENYHGFLLVRFFQGVCFASCPAIAIPLLAEELRKSWLSSAVGYYIASNTLGGLLSRIIGGMGAEYAEHWAAGGYIITAISVVLFILVLYCLPKQRHFTASRFSLSSCIKAYGNHLTSWRLLLIYMIICIGFGCFVNITNYLMMILEGAPYNMSSDMRSMMFVTLLGGTMSSSLAGKFARKHNPVTGVGVGIVIMLTSVGLLFQAPLIFVVSGMILLSFGFFFCHANASALVGQSVKTAKGSAQALYSLSYYSGASLGVFYFEPYFIAFGWQGVLVSSGVLLLIAILLVATYQKLAVKQKPSSIGTA
ncbi:Inner membrane transport protein YnfM [Vibrio hippocampi]|uniref:Inner membrane transport protein YnfM n=2 Tax=Vibrio hippocampi TaxID=654686 RepID=A0ABN8DKF8_9VIBR|nr:Inner membrane transport protein YnfM [Vibrio hippocampi]